MIAIKN